MINRKILLVLAACVFPLAAGEIPEKAERYRTLLLRKPENPVLFSRMLDAWLEEKELEGLVPELELRAKEGDAADWRLLAVYHEHAGDEEAALKALDEAVKLSPDDSEARLARGKVLGTALRFEGALEDLAVAAADPELAVEAGTLRGKLLARSGRPAEAVEAWKKLIADHPEDEGLKEDLIELEIGEGLLEEAVTAARELAEATADPYKKALRRVQVAEILAQAGKKDESLEEYRGVFAISADGSWLEREVLARAGALFAREDDSAGLKQFLLGLREEHPRRIAVKKEAAKAELASGGEEEAIAMFREVLKVLPGDRAVREEFIALLESAGRSKEAAEELEALIGTAAGDAALWERLAILKQSLNDGPGTEAALAKAVALIPGDESGLVSQARLLERFGKKDEAEKALRAAATTHGGDGEAGEALAAFLVANDRGDEALALWKEMAAKSDREGLLRIVRSLTAHGKASDAYALLEPRVAEFPDDALLLSALCQAAQLTDAPEDAVPHALALVRLAKNPTDLDSSLRLATSLISRAEEPRKWLDDLAARPDLTLPERCLLSELHEALGDSIAAEQVLKDAMADDDSLVAANQRVRLLEIRGQLEAATAAMRELLALPGGMKTAHVKKLVELLERSGDYDGAQAETLQWLKLAPGDKVAWTKRADLFLADGRPAEAVAELRRAVAKFGGEDDLRAKLAGAQEEAGMAAEAWRSYTALFEESETPTEKLKWVSSLARIALMEGREEELVSDFRRRSRDNPTSTLPLLALAEIYREWQNPDEELKAVAEASRRKSDDGALVFRHADLLELSGEAEAASALLRGLTGGPDAPEARRRLAARWIREGETERGLAELAATGKGADPRMVEKLVMPLIVTKEWDAAITVLERESAANPGDWRLSYLHAVALLEAGRKEEAFGKFVALLEADGDLPGVIQPRSNSVGYAVNVALFGQPAATISRSAIETFQSLRQIAISHRDGNDLVWSGRGPREVYLPTGADQLRRLALIQAVEICQGDPENRETLMGRITSSHFDDLPALKRVVLLQPDELKALLTSEEATPDMYHWYLIHPRLGRADPDVLRRGLEVTEKDWPEVALVLGHQLWSSSGSGADESSMRKSMELLGRLPPERIGSHLELLIQIAFSPVASAELRAEAEKVLMERIENTPLGVSQVWAIQNLHVNWMRAGNHERAVEWLNRLHAEPQKYSPTVLRTNQSAYSQRMLSLHGEGSLQFHTTLQELSSQFPREESVSDGDTNSKLIEQQRELLELIGGNDQDTALLQQSSLPQIIDYKAFAAHADKLVDPVMRIAAYQAAGLEEKVAGEIAALEGSENPSSSGLLLAAAYRAGVSKSPEQAYGLLVRASGTPDSPVWRGRIEQQLVAIGAEMAQSEDVDLEPARRAALRMRREVSHNVNLRARLAESIKSLGMEEEAARFVGGTALFNPRRSATRTTSGILSSSAQAKLNEEISKLVGEDKRDAAARRVLSALRQYATDPNREYLSQQLHQLISSLSLADEVIRADAPDEGAGFPRRKGHAMLLLSLEKREAALPYLRALAKEKPDDREVVTALFNALPEEEQREQAVASASGDFDPQAMGQMFVSWMEKSTAAERLAAAQAMTEVITALKPDPSFERNLSWVNYAALSFAREDRLDVALSPLLTPPDAEEQSSKEASERRVEAAGKLFRAMLRHPQTAEQGFILLQGSAANLGVEPEELDQAALEAIRVRSLKRESENSQPGVGNAYYRQNRRNILWAWVQPHGASSRGMPESGISPDAYLARRAVDGVILNPFDDAFLKEVAAYDEKTARVLERARAITSVDGTSAFELWRKEASTRRDEAGAELEWIHRLAEKKGRTDLQSLMVDYACETLVSQVRTGSGDLPAAIEILRRSVSDPADPQIRIAAFARIAESILGPEKGWALYASIANSPIQIPEIATRRSAFQVFTNSFQGDIAGSIAVHRFVFAHRLRSVSSFDSNVVPSLASSRSVNVKPWIESGLFASGTGPASPLQSPQDSLIGQMVTRLKNDREVAAKLGEELLKIDGDERFWARLTGAVLTNQSAEAAKELDRQAAIIATWSDRDRLDLFRFVEASLPDTAGRTTGNMKKMFADSLNRGDEEARREAQVYLENGVPSNTSPWTSNDPVRVLVLRLVKDDPAVAAKLWGKALESLRLRSQPGQFSSNGGYAQSSDGYAHLQMIVELASQTLSAAELSAFLMHFGNEDAARYLGLSSGSFGHNLNSLFTREGNRRADVASLKIVSTLPESRRRSAGLLAAITEDAPKATRSSVAVLWLIRQLTVGDQSQGQNEVAPFIRWAQADLKKLDPAAAHAAVLSELLNCPFELDEASEKNLHASFTALVSDKAIPEGLRMELVAAIPRWSRLDDPSVGNAVAGLYAGYLTPERVWANDSMISPLGKVSELKQFAAADAKKVFDSLQASRIEFAATGSGNENGRASIASLQIALALRAGDPESITKATRSSAASMRGRLDFALKLVEGGLAKEGVPLFARPGEFHVGMGDLFGDPFHRNPAFIFTREREAKLSEWLIEIPDPAQRYRLECVISSFPDATDGTAPVVKRIDRIAALAKRFEAEAPKPRAARMETLVALGAEPASSSALAREFANLSSGSDLGTVATLRNGRVAASPDESQVVERLLRLSIQLALEVDGDPSVLVKQLESLQAAAATDRGWAARSIVEKYFDGYTAQLVRRTVELEGEKKTTAAAAALRVGELLLGFEDTGIQRDAIGVVIASQAAAGDGEAVDRWLKALPVHLRVRYETQLKEAGLRHGFGGLKAWPLTDPQFESSRRAVLAAILTDPATVTREITQPTVLTLLIQNEVFSQDDLFAVIDGLSADHPQRAKFLTEKAGIFSWRTDNPEESLKLYDAADAAAKESGNGKDVAHALAYRAHYLSDRLGKLEEAVAVAREIQLDDLDQTERERTEAIISQDPKK